jgi:DNA-binding PadR family transcriptional regulator
MSREVTRYHHRRNIVFRTTSHPDARRHHRDPHRGPSRGDLPFGVRGMFGRERWGRGQPVRRGEIRPLIVAALLTKPMHGYEVIQALETQSGGRWRPSAGSVYPTLQLLADEGLVTSEEVDGRRTYTLTDAGRADAVANPAPRPWTDESPDGATDLPELVRQFVGAVMQVERMGSAQAHQESIRILTDARRQVYRLLAEDGGEKDDAVESPRP